jgi:hypothetical protein
VLADYKCVIDVFGGTETIRIYSNPSSSKITDEKSISDKISAIEVPIEEKPVDGGTQIEPKDEGAVSTSATATVVTKSLDKMMVAKLPRMVGGQYALNIECGDGKTTETALSSVTVEPVTQAVFGTQYEAGSPMKIFTQLANGDVYSNGTCFLTMYYPDTTKFLNGVVMTPVGENGLYYYDIAIAPSTLGIYMVSVRCSFPSNLGNTTELQYEDGIDTHVDSSNANVNYGADEMLYVERTTPTEIALIKPNITYLVGKNYTIIGATLHLFKFGGSGTSNAIDVVPITSSWAESTVTYNTRPTFSMFSCTGNSPTTVTATNDWYSWDMTRCIQNLTDGANSTPYHGFAINATTLSVNKIFYSSDYAGWQLGPNLIITFADTENLSFYSQQVTEIQVVPATFNGSIDLTELGRLANQTNYETHQICLESGVCIDDPKFYDYRRDFITTSSLTDYLNFSNVAAIVSLGLLLLIYISVRHNKRNGYKFVQHGGYREA